MAGKSTLVKVFVALAAFFVAAPWAAGTSNIAEGESSSVYCVKLVGDEDGSYIELSQKAANASVQGEQCYEWWYTQDGSPSAYSALQDFFQAEYPPAAVRLTSDLYFGGYDGSQCVSGANAYHPFEFGVEQERILLTSSLTTPFTIHGVCYQGGASEASFGGNLFSTIQNVKFKDLHLESLTSAGLFSYVVGSAEAVKISVTNSVVRAPVAGTLAGAIESILVSEFNGNSVTVNAIPGLDQGESFSVNEVNIGSLVGICSALSVGLVKLSDVYVIYQPMPGESYLDSSLPDGNAYVGGIAGSVASIDNNDMDRSASLSEVGLENMVITDYAEGDGANYVGGLIGKFDGTWLSVMRTYTVGDILCTSDKCVQGYGAGLIKFTQYPQVTVVANYHYSENEQERVEAFAGMVVGHYLTEYADAGVTGAPDTVITDEFNKSGYIPNYTEEYVDDERTFVKDDVSVASGNYRNAVGSISATEGFDSETYTFDDPAEGTVPNGVLNGEYMRSASFIEILDHIPGVLTSGDTPWKFGDSQATPYFDISTDDSGEDYVQPAEVYFSFDCVRYTNCLTEEEVLELEQFENNKVDPDGYMYKFIVSGDGTIENTEWLDFAFNLTLENPDRDPLYWEQGLYQPFSINNTYDYSVTYTLKKADDARDVKVYAFFGKGIDYDRTIVELISYDGEDVGEKGNEIDRANYSGGDQPVVMNVGNIMQVTARNPVTTDGSAFRGWTVLAEMVYMTDDDGLRKKAFAGVPVYVYSDGSFSFDEIGNILSERFETPEDSQYRAWKAEQEKISQEMQSYAMSGEVDEDSMSRIIARGDSISQLMDEWAENKKSTVYDDVVIVLAIYPTGFEDQNEPDDDSGNNGSDDPEKKITYPALFYSGNAIQLAVKTDKFVYEESAPFVSVLLENLNGETLYDKLFEFTDGAWPEIFTWEKYPLAPGRYLLTAKIYDGTNQNPEVRQWDFEVKSQIADSGEGQWYMVSLWNVDFDKYDWSDDGVFYWWDEFAIYGKYWQYKEFTKKDSPEQAKGYWYNSLEGRPLVLKDEAFTGEIVWHLDSVNTGWNLVSNPYGWFVDIGAESNEFGDELYDEQIKWLEEEASNREEVDEEWLREEREWIEEERRMHQPAVEFFHWDPVAGQYEEVKTLAPYEAVWAKVNRGQTKDWELQPVPAFVATVNEDGDTVMVKSLKKKGVLAKAAGNSGWALQVELSDASGKMDSWNMLGAGKVAWSSEEPPAGMGNRVNLSIVDAGRRLAKSVKALGEDAYEWNVELSATSARAGYLKFAGIGGILASGLRVFVTVDGVTTEMHDGEKLQVKLSTTAKSANIRVAKSARKVVASTLQGLRAHNLGSVLQVGFDVGEGLAGANARVDLVDTKGHVVNTASFKAENGRNEVSLERPVRGLYVLRAVVGREIAVQKIMVK